MDSTPPVPPSPSPPSPLVPPGGGTFVPELVAPWDTNDNNDAAIVLWRERERRQRTVRVLMMFLVMLLLMDGDETANNGSYPKRLRSGANNNNNYPHNKHDSVYEAKMLESRRQQEERIAQVTRKHARYQSLVKKNGGKDISARINDWAEQQAEQEEDEFAPEDTARRKQRQREGVLVPETLAQKEHNEDDQKVWHYPWNSTGFYRGEWTRTHQKTTTASALSTQHTESTATEETVTTTPLEEKSNRRIQPVVLNAPALEATMLTMLQKRHEQIGVFLLPENHQIVLRNDNNLTSIGYEHITVDPQGRNVYSNNNNNNQPQHLQLSNEFSPVLASVERTASSSTSQSLPHDKGLSDPHLPQRSVTMTRDSGRAAFQLFSRSIPAMKELSLVDGFVKLYDSNSPGYSTRKDILLRVRGVLVHSIGRLSLVANANANRSAFVINDDTEMLKTTQQQHVEGSLQESEPSELNSVSSSTPVNQEYHHRRLLQAMNNIEIADINTVREDALALFGDKVSEKKADSIFSSIEFISGNEESMNERDSSFDKTDGNTIHGMSKVTLSADKDSPVSKVVSSSKSRKLAQGSSLQVDESKRLHADVSSTEKNDEVKDTVDIGHTGIASVVGQVDSVKLSSTSAVLSSNIPLSSSTSAVSRKLVDNNKTAKIKQKELQQSTSSSKSTLDTLEGTLPASTHVSRHKLKERIESQLPPWSNIVLPYPFVRDDKEESIRKTRTPAARRMPPREQLLEANAASCEFEINMDVQEVEWSVGTWRTLVTRRVKDANKLNSVSQGSEAELDEDKSGIGPLRAHTLSRQSRRLKPPQDEALVVTMVGVIRSHNCNFEATINATAQRTDWDATTSKAVSYSFNMMLVCLVQILVLLRQLLYSQSPAVATRVSLLCIGWQTVIDALVCFAHIYLSLALQPLFTAFASVAFFKLLIFCVIEMKYMAMIIQARNSSNGGQTAEVLRRQVAMLHLRFYVALFGTFLLTFYVGDKYRLPYILALYSFWVPQIVMNIITEAKAPLHKNYIYGMSISRLVAPLYTFGVSNNFLKEVYPDSPTDVFTCQILVLWIIIQTAVLIAQGKYGARFMIPARFLPPKFDYSRPLPPSMLPPGMLHHTSPSDTLDCPRSGSSDVVVKMNEPTPPPPRDRHTTAVTTRNRMRRANRNETTMTTETDTAPTEHTLDCSICYDAIDVRNRRGYMFAPCDHIFHRDCLVQWMDVKMECPICRTELPAL